MSRIFHTLVSVSLLGNAVLVSSQQSDGPPQLPRPRSEVDLVIGDRIGTQLRIAVPDCLAPSDDAENRGHREDYRGGPLGRPRFRA